MKTFTALIQKEGKWYISTCAEVGTTSQGSTIEEALKNLQEATELYLEEFPIKQTEYSPLITTFQVPVHA